MSDYTVRYLKEEEYEQWDAFVDSSEYGSMFHKSYWNQAILALDPGVSLQVVACFKADRLVAGLITGSKKKLGFLRTMVPPYASPFYGVLLKERDTDMRSKQESYRQEVLDELLAFTERDYQIINFSLLPGFEDIRSFNQRSYISEQRYTYLADTTRGDQLFDGFLPALRRQIKKGEKLDYEIRELAGPEELNIVYNLIETSYRRQKHRFRFNRQQFETFMEHEFLKKHFKVYSIWYENKPVAAVVLLLDRERAYYWLAGVDPQFSNTGLNQVLLWQLLKKMPELGIASFDFMGANTPSIAKYKSGFNFELLGYHQLRKESGKGARQLMSIKRFIKRVAHR